MNSAEGSDKRVLELYSVTKKAAKMDVQYHIFWTVQHNLTLTVRLF